jgi:hypothetical protein
LATNRTRAELRFQDAGSDETNLLELLLDASEHAESGGGIFAWTNASGINALFASKSFEELLNRGRFDLVVGIDSITNEAAVKALIASVDRWPNLFVRVFMHEKAGMFHPKMAWFKTAAGLTLIVGSGNFTMGGLRSNWEAYAVVEMAGSAVSGTLSKIDAWLVAWEENLIPIGDSSVIERAKKNVGNERSLKRGTRVSVPKPSVLDEGQQLLIAEIPKVQNRPSQANFTLEIFERFFGIKRGTKHVVLLYHVRADGALDTVESRQSVESQSQNYRLELQALKGLPKYEGYAVGVFLRLETGLFLYLVLLQGSPEYQTVSLFLEAHWSGPANQLRRYRTTEINEFKQAWPESPLWAAEVPEL